MPQNRRDPRPLVGRHKSGRGSSAVAMPGTLKNHRKSSTRWDGAQMTKQDWISFRHFTEQVECSRIARFLALPGPGPEPKPRLSPTNNKTYNNQRGSGRGRSSRKPVDRKLRPGMHRTGWKQGARRTYRIRLEDVGRGVVRRGSHAAEATAEAPLLSLSRFLARTSSPSPSLSHSASVLPPSPGVSLCAW